jgi:hexokinase
MFAGGYFGDLCLTALKSAAKEGVFSDSAAVGLTSINSLSSEDANNFVSNPETYTGSLVNCIRNPSDKEGFS